MIAADAQRYFTLRGQRGLFRRRWRPVVGFHVPLTLGIQQAEPVIVIFAEDRPSEESDGPLQEVPRKGSQRPA